MKKIILALLFITSIAVMANAQDAGGPAKSPEQRALRMTKTLGKKLSLSLKQAKRIDKIYLKQAIELDSIRNYPSNDRRVDMQQKKFVKRTTNKKIMRILTTEQRQQFVQYQKMKKQKNNNKKSQQTDPAPNDDGDGDNTQG